MCHQFRNEKNFILKVSMRSHEPVRKNLPPNSLYKSQQERSSDTPKFGARKCCFVLVTKKKKKEMHTSIHKWVWWGGVIRIRLEFKSRGWHVYANLLPIHRRPAISGCCNRMKPKRAQAATTLTSPCSAAAVLNLKHLPPLFSNKDLWTTGISLLCNREWSNCKLISDQRVVLRQLAPERFVLLA